MNNAIEFVSYDRGKYTPKKVLIVVEGVPGLGFYNSEIEYVYAHRQTTIIDTGKWMAPLKSAYRICLTKYTLKGSSNCRERHPWMRIKRIAKRDTFLRTDEEPVKIQESK